jgi:P27 family predicted phage terminase small subunit
MAKRKPQFPAPSYLDELATTEWNRIVLLLGDKLTDADLQGLTSLCCAFSRMVTAQQQLQTQGLTVISAKTGWPAPNPLISIVNSASETVRQLSKEYGLTPASRKRMKHADDQANAIKRNDLIR